jgi:hypothetical protein
LCFALPKDGREFQGYQSPLNGRDSLFFLDDYGGMAYLPTEILVIRVSNVERFGRESIRLNLNICTGDLIDETEVKFKVMMF